jgi:hypothetical protein
MKLTVSAWPIAGNVSGLFQDEITSNFISMSIDESFTPTSGSKGSYLSQFNIQYWASRTQSDGATKYQNASLASSGGYDITGVEIANQAAVPRPPSLDNLYITCTVTATPELSDFVDSDGNIIPLYKFDAFYSQSTELNVSAPSITSAFSSTGDPVQCWPAWTVSSCDSNNMPVLSGTPSTNAGTFTLLNNWQAMTSNHQSPPSCLVPNYVDMTSAMMIPLFCAVPSNTQVSSSLQFFSPTSGASVSVKCSDLAVQGLDITWSYDGTPSSCAKDGSMTIGRLVNNNTTPAQSGPLLQATSCVWQGSSSTSCNAYQVLRRNRSASLQSVTLSPSDIKIQDGSTTLTCN